MTSQYTQFQPQELPLSETPAVAFPADTTETASLVPSEPLSPSKLLEQGGIAVAIILAISVFVLALAEFVKVLDREN
ncbi:MAG: hypothetical protein SW833_19835 [Cyanobacteriota bacterium]|nr:hypothetical protein [Cyanobacteriota bacterium]